MSRLRHAAHVVELEEGLLQRTVQQTHSMNDNRMDLMLTAVIIALIIGVVLFALRILFLWMNN